MYSTSDNIHSALHVIYRNADNVSFEVIKIDFRVNSIGNGNA